MLGRVGCSVAGQDGCQTLQRLGRWLNGWFACGMLTDRGAVMAVTGNSGRRFVR